MKKVLLVIVLLAVVLAPAGLSHAAPHNDKIIAEDEVHDGDLEVFGDELDIQPGATVDGNVSVFGGDVNIDGAITGDVAIFGGDTTLTGTIDGDFVVFGGDITIAETAHINGDCVLVGGASKNASEQTSCTNTQANIPNFPGMGNIMPIPNPSVPNPPSPPSAPNYSFGHRVGHFFSEVGEVILSSLMAGGVAFLVASVLPGRVTQIRSAVEEKPAASGVVGALTAVAAPSLIALLSILSALLVLACGIGLLGFPIVIALAAALAIASIFGWVAIGSIVGTKLAKPLRITNDTLPMTAAIGTGAVTLVLTGLGLIGFFPAELLMSLIACVGLGAVALTKFGTRAYPPDPFDNSKIEAILDSLPE